VNLGYPHGPKIAPFVPPGAKRRTIRYTVKRRGAFTLHIITGEDRFACEDDKSPLLGSQFGEAISRRFNAVYDRGADRLVTVRAPRLKLYEERGGFRAEGVGPLTVELKPNYIKQHLGYFLWKADRPLWAKPVAGWCSWMAHLQDVNENDVKAATTFFSENLRDYGYTIIQIDDGYQRASQSGEPPLEPDEVFAELWTKPNAKFPGGLTDLAKFISQKGMTPGIWVGLFMPLGIRHAEGYITGANRKPIKGPWVNYAVNGLLPASLDEAYIKTIRDLKAMGWRYFKIDTLRHVLYDNYYRAPEYWKKRKQSPETAFRKIMQTIKSTAGDDIYVLACWGTIPELAGIANGCRIGEDVGPEVASMRRSAKYIAQFHHLNQVVWRNDPDYMCLRLPTDQAQAWVTMTALAGGHLMVSDPVKEYDADRIELLRKVGPPMVLKPTVVRPLAPDPEWMTLDAEKDGEQWSVVARMAWQVRPSVAVPLEQFGLSPDQDYLAFDFWLGKPIGVVRGSTTWHELKEGQTQVIAFRPLLDHPQVWGTDRHIGQGVVELDHVVWNENSLSGTFRRGKGQNWQLFLHVPTGWTVQGVEGASMTRSGEALALTFPEGSASVSWKATFLKEP
jgi:alpha-galactosidase